MKDDKNSAKLEMMDIDTKAPFEADRKVAERFLRARAR
jgi:hypothetical protein